MNRKGVHYDVGRVMGMNWRPNVDPKIVQRELEIIKNNIHCNAVRICGPQYRAANDRNGALKQGLEVWISPEMWDKSPEKILANTLQSLPRQLKGCGNDGQRNWCSASVPS